MSHFIKMPNSCQDSFSMNVSISHQIHPKANYMTHAIHIKAPFSCFINNWHAVFYLFVFVFLLSNLMKKHLKQQMTPSNFRAKKLFLWVYKLWLAVEMSVWSDWCVFVLSEREWLSWCMHMSMLSLCDSGIWTSFPAYFSLFWCLAGLSSKCFLLRAALKRNHNAIEAPRPLNHTLGWEVDFLLLSRPVAISRCLTPCLSNRMPLLLASPWQCIFPAPRERPPCGRAT